MSKQYKNKFLTESELEEIVFNFESDSYDSLPTLTRMDRKPKAPPSQIRKETLYECQK